MRLMALFLFAGILSAQPAFEVAAIHLAEPGNMKGVRGGCHGIDSRSTGDIVDVPLGRCVITDGRLSHMIVTAWQLKEVAMIQNAPDWVIGTDERYTLQAKAEDTHATEAQLREMLQRLLVERFQLKFHREDRQEKGYALVIAKGGPKMEKSQEGDVTSLGPFNKANPTVTIAATRYSMSGLTQFLSTFGPGHVKDETGLDGFFNFKLTWNDNEGPSVFSALQQIGLQLQPAEVAVSYFVIESAQRPAQN